MEAIEGLCDSRDRRCAGLASILQPTSGDHDRYPFTTRDIAVIEGGLGDLVIVSGADLCDLVFLLV